MPTLDLYVAYLNAVYFHRNTLTLHILALAVVILFTVSAQADDWFWENPTFDSQRTEAPDRLRALPSL
jgi:hypothetical protein